MEVVEDNYYYEAVTYISIPIVSRVFTIAVIL